MSQQTSKSGRLAAVLARIEGSLFLTKERRGTLREIAPKLSDRELEELENLLQGEDEALASLLSVAVKEENKKSLASLDSYLHESTKNLRHLEEHAESIDEQAKAGSSLQGAQSP